MLIATLPPACASSRPAASVSASPSPLPSLGATAPIASSPSPPASVTTVASGFDLARAMSDVRALSVDIGLRSAGTPGASRAAGYIAAGFASSGLAASEQSFPIPQGGVSWNVLGAPAGFDERKPYVIVGGHYDTRNGPGANDNATGIAATLEIARLLHGRATRVPVLFVAFGAEEVQPVPGTGHHHIGSRFYVAHMSADAKRNLVSYVNLDMIGRGGAVYCMRMTTGSREGMDRCVRTGAAIGVLALPVVTPDWSDNGTFLRAGLDASSLWTGDDTCYNHTLRDVYGHVVPADFDRAGRLALAVVLSYTR